MKIRMDKYIESFGDQMCNAVQIGKSIKKRNIASQIQNIILCGMGGSGIGAAIVKDITLREINIPVIVHHDYDLPGFANKNSLVICSSYSGETSETISTLNASIKRGCQIICISSGGLMEKIALDKKIVCIKVPGGMPPRSCLGYSIIIQLYILFNYGLYPKRELDQIETIATFLQKNKSSIKSQAKRIAQNIRQKTILIYAPAPYESVALRWKQQFNENPEVHSYSNSIPEMNHNELVAFRKKKKNIAVICLRTTEESVEIKRRMDLSSKIMKSKVGFIYDVVLKDENVLKNVFSFIHLGDWISFYLSEILHVDAMEIQVLEKLKSELKKVI